MSGSGTLLDTGGASSHDGVAPPLPRQASNGGREAFTLLYDLFEQRVFNFCHRVLGSADDAAQATQETFLSVLTGPDKRQGHDSNFRGYLFAAAHDACQLVAGGRQGEATHPHPHPSGEPGEVCVDPERAASLSSLQEGVRGANRTLAETEREVLALRELEYFSYAEIAEIMRTDHDAVPGLIAGARLRLRDELRASALAGAAGSAADCRRALPLTVMVQDAQPIGVDEREWLAGHLRTCEACRAKREAMEEAGISYRAWLRIFPLHWLREATVARAAELADVVPTQPLASAGDKPHAEADDEDQAEADGGKTVGGDGYATLVDDTIDAAGEAPGGMADVTVAVGPGGPDDYDRRRFALGAFSTLLLLLGVGAAMVIASTGGNPRRAVTSEPAGVRDAAITGSAPAPIPSATGTREPRRRTRRAVVKPTTPSSGALSTRVVTTAPSPPRRSPKPVRRSPVRHGAEGGAFIPTPTRPSPPVRSTPSTPTSPPPTSRPTGATPSGKACGSPAGVPGAC